MTIDVHGLTIKELPKFLDDIMYKAVSTRIEEIEFITGLGPLQDAIMDMCVEVYKCGVRRKMDNKGILIVSFSL